MCRGGASYGRRRDEIKEGWCALLRKLGKLERVRNERSLTVGELARKSGVPRATITGLEEGTRRAQQTTTDKLAGALGVEPGELANEEGVTVLEEKVGDRVRVVKRYEDHTLEMSYDESRLGDAYRFILENLGRLGGVSGAHARAGGPVRPGLGGGGPGQDRARKAGGRGVRAARNPGR